MDNLPLSLTIEQQFELKRAEAEIRRMSQDQAQEMLLELIENLRETPPF